MNNAAGKILRFAQDDISLEDFLSIITVELEEVAMATQFGDVIEIYNLNNGDSSCFVGNQGAPKENDGQIEGFCDIKWVGENIYTLFSGRLRADLIRKSEAGKKEPMGGNIIKVFDRGGNVLEEYELDTYIKPEGQLKIF